ncbi:sigma-70 family RNA polymerase sigma factor (plasmid) [Streptomyces sp. C1-1]|uniref:sigma-70 family RNA polymerase sigma factor n=1 Tax=Streptomyces sp. C1-1 TaxID=3231173 RepID=UPI003D054FF4
MSEPVEDLALEAVYERYYGEMVGYAGRRLREAGTPLSHVDAEDVVQDAFAEAFRSPQRIVWPRAYLYKVIKNRLQELQERAERAHQLAELPASSAVSSVEEVVIAVCDVQRALAQLPTQQRRAVYAAKALGFTQHEVAESMGKRLGTVGVHIARGVQVLRAALMTTAAVAAVITCIGAVAGLRYISAASRGRMPVSAPHDVPAWIWLTPLMITAAAVGYVIFGSVRTRWVGTVSAARPPDVTALGTLLLYLPNFLCSLSVLCVAASFLGRYAVLVILLWVASGALVFHRPTERAIARRFMGLRQPTPQELARLDPVWREVLARAGLAQASYELWVENSDLANGIATASHLVCVTRFAIKQLPSHELAAVLAHELGHHIGGHAWASLLGYWYALPSRIVWRITRAVARVVFLMARVFGFIGMGLVLAMFGSLLLSLALVSYGLPVIMLVVPYALAYTGRRAELRADRYAAHLGFGPALTQLLTRLHHEEQQQHAAAKSLPRAGTARDRLGQGLASHPDYATRLKGLEPYLPPTATSVR